MSTPVKIDQLPLATSPLTGAELAVIVQNGITSQTTVQQIGSQVVNVKNFGAKGDGSTDDTAAFVAAMAAGAGKAVYVPATSSYYRVTATITIPANTLVYGDGAPSAIQMTGTVRIFTINQNNVTLQGLKLIGNNTPGIPSFFAANCQNPIVRNCMFQNWRFGTRFSACKNIRVQSNLFYGGQNDGASASDIFIYGSAGSENNRVIITENFCLSNNDVGINVDTNAGDKEVIIANNIIYPLASDGVTPLADTANLRRNGIFLGYVAGVSTRAVVEGNYIRDIPYQGIGVQAATLPAGDVNIVGNNLQRCGFGVTYNGATETTGVTDGSTAVITGLVDTSDFVVGAYATVSAGFPSPSTPYRILAKTASSLTMEVNSTSAQTGVTVSVVNDNSLKAGIYLIGGGADVLTGNIVLDCEGAGIKVAPNFTFAANMPKSTISNNGISRTKGYGIWMTNRPNGYIVANNKVINSTVYNIYYDCVASDAGNCLFSGNHVDAYFPTVTGNTDGSTGVITNVTDTSGFIVNQTLYISAGFSSVGPHFVTAKTATTLTVSSTSNSVQTGVSIKGVTGGITVFNASGGYTNFIVGNKVTGTDASINFAQNSGIRFDGGVRCEGNEISIFSRGIQNDSVINTRRLDLLCHNNAINNCTYGIVGGGGGTWLVSGNTFNTVTNFAAGTPVQGTLQIAGASTSSAPIENIITVGSTSPVSQVFARGDVVWNSTPSAAGAPGWVCVFSLSTTLSAGEPSGETSMAVTSGTGTADGDIIGVLQDNNAIHWTSIASGGGTTTLVLTSALTGAAAAGKTVYVYRFKEMADLDA